MISREQPNCDRWAGAFTSPWAVKYTNYTVEYISILLQKASTELDIFIVETKLDLCVQTTFDIGLKVSRRQKVYYTNYTTNILWK